MEEIAPIEIPTDKTLLLVLLKLHGGFSLSKLTVSGSPNPDVYVAPQTATGVFTSALTASLFQRSPPTGTMQPEVGAVMEEGETEAETA